MKPKDIIEEAWQLNLKASAAMRSSALNHLFGQFQQAIKSREVSNADIARIFMHSIQFGIKSNSK